MLKSTITHYVSMLKKVVTVSLLVSLLDLLASTALGSAQLLPFGKSGNFWYLPKDDDSVHARICLTNFSFRIFSKNCKCLFLNNNGIITTDEPYTSCSPTSLDRVIELTKKFSIIAPFWADVDTNSLGNVSYWNTTDSTLLAQVDEYVHKKSDSFRSFKAKVLVIITWDRVGHYGSNPTKKTNTFQCNLIVGENDTFVMFAYSNISWITGSFSDSRPASVGYATADHKHIYEHPWSLTDDIINITNDSNVGIPGVFIFHLGEDKPLFKSDPAHPDISYFTGEVIEEVIPPGENQKVVIGDKEDMGFKANLSGTVPQGKKVTFKVEAVFRTRPSPGTASAQDKTHAKQSDPIKLMPTAVVNSYEPVSLLYAIEATGTELLEKIFVEIAHSAVIKTNQDKERMFFLIFKVSENLKSAKSTLKLVRVKTGELLTNSEGDAFGIVNLKSLDFDKKLFIELARKHPLLTQRACHSDDDDDDVLVGAAIGSVMGAIMGLGGIFMLSYGEGERVCRDIPSSTSSGNEYSLQFYKRQQYSLASEIAVVIGMCPNHGIKKVMQAKIIQAYKHFSMSIDVECYNSEVVSFAAGYNEVLVSYTRVKGWSFIRKIPTKIKKSVIDGFDYSDAERLLTDPDFPASVFFKLVQKNESAEGVSYFSFSGLDEKELRFPVELKKLGNACSLNPCQNGGSCTTVHSTYKCECKMFFYGHKCEHEVMLLTLNVLWQNIQQFDFKVPLMTILIATVIIVVILSCCFTAKGVDVSPSTHTLTLLQKLLSEVGMLEADLDHEVKDIHLHQLSLSLADWEFYAVPLGLAEADISAIKLDSSLSPKVKTRTALIKWKSLNTHLATYRVLVVVFIKHGNLKLSRILCNMRKGAMIEDGSQEINDPKDYLKVLKPASEPTVDLQAHYPDPTKSKDPPSPRQLVILQSFRNNEIVVENDTTTESTTYS